LHQHSREDEWFYVLDGEYRFLVGEEIIRVGKGDSLFAPPNIPHTFQNIAKEPGRLLAVNQPGGLEAFFAELEEATASGMPEPAKLTPSSRDVDFSSWDRHWPMNNKVASTGPRCGYAFQRSCDPSLVLAFALRSEEM
jgi:glyoxylate utilization-related uncharacterized protein